VGFVDLGGEVLVGRGGSSFVTKCVSEYTEFCFVCYNGPKILGLIGSRVNRLFGSFWRLLGRSPVGLMWRIFRSISLIGWIGRKFLYID
jgi:hypothetical protein